MHAQPFIDTTRGLAAAGAFLAAVVDLDLWVHGFAPVSTTGRPSFSTSSPG
jgi:hypothetical protein